MMKAITHSKRWVEFKHPTDRRVTIDLWIDGAVEIEIDGDGEYCLVNLSSEQFEKLLKLRTAFLEAQ